MLNSSDVIEATGGEIISSGTSGFSGISIDSRTIKSGEIFVALKGNKFDGHDFVKHAVEEGEGAIVDSLFRVHNSKFRDKTVILVENTLIALHSLARYMRKRFSGNVIGVVGSNGKTTTKELISSILGTRSSLLKTFGNLNNHIGMPLSIVNGMINWRAEDDGAMVLEMGTNRPGDIDELCSIADPDIGVITNIGYEHLRGFGSLQKVRDSELEILPYVKRVIVNADDLFLMEGIRSAEFGGEVITFGIETDNADLSARDIIFSEDGTRFSIYASKGLIDINSSLLGRFNVYNSLSASATAYAVGFNLQEIKKGLESFEGVRDRFELKKYRGVMLLNDVYNANPSSMDESISETVRLLKYSGEKDCRYKRAIVVLGDMLELGDYGVIAHKKLGQRLSKLSVDTFIGVGPLMSFAVSEFGKGGICTATPDDAAWEAKKILKDGDIVLIKGSREMGMEKVTRSIESGLEK
ncbi:UDP-N-acetylmuramoyl-tripeptide--D-alanyl-D-alanine ligase [Thermodesulfovibrionales bacterium]|nr:UDP-N-acetylmuramoyl-tripeptide--D-alanyl-D-alanine ligase [Thermodesulfovibrionales bacterium]